MPSAFIPSVRSYPAMLLAEQLVHQWYVHPGPLVLRTAPFKFPAPATDREDVYKRQVYMSSKVICENYNVSDYINSANLIYFYNLKSAGGGDVYKRQL